MNGIAGALGIDPALIVGPAWVTLAYVLLYYLFICNVLRVKISCVRAARAKGQRFDRYFGQDRHMLAADRIQLNMLEHMPIFLVLLWLLAFVGSATEATVLGAIYTGLRVIYPIAMGTKLARFPTRILPITFGGYAILLVFCVRIGMNLSG